MPLSSQERALFAVLIMLCVMSLFIFFSDEMRNHHGRLRSQEFQELVKGFSLEPKMALPTYGSTSTLKVTNELLESATIELEIVEFFSSSAIPTRKYRQDANLKGSKL